MKLDVIMPLLLGLLLAAVTCLSGCAHESTEVEEVEKIVFRSTRTGSWEIFLTSPDGTYLKQVTFSDSSALEPSLAPDGRIAFESASDGDREIYSVNYDGSDRRQLTNNLSDDRLPEWSLDGRKILFVRALYACGAYDIFVMNRDGSHTINITNSPESEYWPKWSPDGAQITFCRTVDGNSEIFIMNSDGSGAQQLTSDLRYNRAPSWSPDGTRIAFHSRRTEFPRYTEIFIMDVDGTNIKQVTSEHYDEEPVWSPDSSRLAFVRHDGPGSQILIIRLDGSGEINFTNAEGENTCPDWKLIRYKEESLNSGLVRWNRY